MWYPSDGVSINLQMLATPGRSDAQKPVDSTLFCMSLFRLTILLLILTGKSSAEERLLRTVRAHQRWVTCVTFSPDGKRIASASDGETLKFWTTQGKLKTSIRVSSSVTSMAFRRDGKRLVTGHWNGAAFIRDASGKKLLALEGHDENITSIVFSRDGKSLASGSGDDTLKVWNATTGEERVEVDTDNEYDVTSVAFSPDGKHILSGDGENLVHLWDARDGEEVMTLRGHEATVSTVTFSPGGKHILSGSWDDTLKLWNAQSGREVRTLRGHQGDVTCASFTPDGKRIVSGSEDKTLIVWDVKSGKKLLTLKGHRDAVTCLAISPDGSTLISGSKDVLRFWNLGKP